MALKPWYKVVTPREDLREESPSMPPSLPSTSTRFETDERRPSTRIRSDSWSGPILTRA